MTNPVSKVVVNPWPCVDGRELNSDELENWQAVREHFDEINDAVGDNDESITTLQTNVTTLQGDSGKVAIDDEDAKGFLEAKLDNWIDPGAFDAADDIAIDFEDAGDGTVTGYINVSTINSYIENTKQLLGKDGNDTPDWISPSNVLSADDTWVQITAAGEVQHIGPSTSDGNGGLFNTDMCGIRWDARGHITQYHNGTDWQNV